MTTKMEAIRAREQAATPGPWEQVDKSVRVSKTYPDLGLYNHAPNAYAGGICNCLGDGMQGKAKPVNAQAGANAAFIAHARADIPLLLAVAEAAAEEYAAQLAYLDAHSAISETDADVDAFIAAAARFDAASEALFAAIAPLKEAE